MSSSKLRIKTKNQSYNVIVGNNLIKNLLKILNDNLMNYNETLGQPATSLQDLVNAGYYGSLDDLPSPPFGTEWQVENGQVIAVPI